MIHTGDAMVWIGVSDAGAYSQSPDRCESARQRFSFLKHEEDKHTTTQNSMNNNTHILL